MTSLVLCNQYTSKTLIHRKSFTNPKPSSSIFLHSKPPSIILASSNSNSGTAPEPADSSIPESIRPRKVRRGRRSEAAAVEDFVRNSLERTFASIREQSAEVLDPEPADSSIPESIRPRKVRRGRRSEAAAVEDFVRNSLERTLASIREQSAEVLEGKSEVLKARDEDDEEEIKGVVEEEDPNWPKDADVGWGVRASEYFEKHPIKNVVADDGTEIDWEGEIEDGWVKEINCLEWERFAFHPSPLIVLVFERYNRASDNWRVLNELVKAAKVYWSAKNHLPPRTVKIDINIETDLAYALKVHDCPQILFLKGNRILYREKEFRTSDELVKMIAHFYYNAKKPSWVDATAVACSH